MGTACFAPRRRSSGRYMFFLKVCDLSGEDRHIFFKAHAQGMCDETVSALRHEIRKGDMLTIKCDKREWRTPTDGRGLPFWLLHASHAHITASARSRDNDD